MDDLISRQAAIDALKSRFSDEPDMTIEDSAFWDHKAVLEVISNQPSAQPERKRGKWERVTNNDNGIDFRCSACHRYRFHNGEMRRKYKFCPNCGADMREDESEVEGHHG